MTGRRELAVTAGIVAGIVLLYFVLPLRGRAWVFSAVLGAVVLGLLGALAPRWGRSIAGAPQPMRRALEGLGVVLAVLVAGFAAAYYAMEVNGGGDFDGLRTKLDALYLAGSRVTTFGFRDVTPVSQPAEVVAAVQLFVDLVFVVVVIRVLSWVAGSRADGGRWRRRQESNPPDGDHPSHSF